MEEYRITAIDQLPDLAEKLISFCKGCRVVAFFGEMGAGKTTFIREICAKLGVLENVSSPTFSIVNEYGLPGGGSVFHFDCYRLKNEEEAITVGVEEYFESGDWCLVEWPEKILYLLPKPRIDVFISADHNIRIIRFVHA
jgi:tRNA threonylcarbamoyladenosine biosynthesis protein TsaE